jgi:hypothetical protein
VEGGLARLAVECDGDECHGLEQYEADMERQRILERCGWEFFRVRECAFRANEEAALEGLWHVLEERGIMTTGESRSNEAGDEDEDASLDASAESESSEDEAGASVSVDEDGSGDQSRRRADDVSSSEIQEAILQCLAECPNNSCTLKSLPSRVMKALRILTRGNPRAEFEKRIMRNVGALRRKDSVQEYKAKNRRIRLSPFLQEKPLFE